MSRTLNRRMMWLMVAVALFAPAEVMVLPVAWSPTSFWEPQTWVTLHAESLPQSVIDIKAFPRLYRKAIVRSFPVEYQARLWREHLAGYIPEANPVQRQVLLDAIDLCGPQLFLAAPELEAVVNSLRDRTAAAFSRRQAAEIFESFGPDAPPMAVARGGLDALRVNVAAWIRGSFHPLAAPPNCECGTGDDWCDSIGNPAEPSAIRHCQPVETCASSSWGCGFLWWYSCDGMCMLN